MVKSHAPNHKPPTKLCCSIFIFSISGSISPFLKLSDLKHIGGIGAPFGGSGVGSSARGKTGRSG